MSVDINKIGVIGISYQELSTEKREIFLQNKPEQIVKEFYNLGKIKGYVPIITCLRVEFYIEFENIDNFILLKNNLNCDESFIKMGEECIRYLLELSCGIHSIIKGEEQILGQIKKSYNDATLNNSTSTFLNVLFNKTIEIGKKFRTESKICHNSLSLEGISLQFIKNYVENITQKKIFILGVGELAQSILFLLKKLEVEDITITNRTHHKALELKNTFGVKVVDFHKKLEILPMADIIISATSAPHIVLHSDEVLPILQDKQYFFLDLAMPRDIDKNIQKNKNVSLFDLDDIWSKYNSNVENRNIIIENYYFLIDKQIENLKKWIKYSNERIFIDEK